MDMADQDRFWWQSKVRYSRPDPHVVYDFHHVKLAWATEYFKNPLLVVQLSSNKNSLARPLLCHPYSFSKFGHEVSTNVMPPFQFKLSNDGVVTGVHFVPPLSASCAKHRPLIVALHGGCYDSQYFDGIPKYSASLASEAFGVPFVSIDRPSYGGTSSILPVPEGSDFYQETGIWLHRYILPALWSEIGAPNQCHSIVLLSHSLGVMGGIIAAALHAEDNAPSYPLSGLIASGMGNTQSSFMKSSPPAFITIDADHVLFPPDKKDAIMFKPGTTVPEVLELCERFNAVSPLPEIVQFPALWLPVWKEKWAAQVSVPVMFSLVDNDPFFVADEGELEVCVQAFKKSSRVDGSLVRGAPHCMELSHWSQGWYARCFGFAMECAASLASSA